MQSIVLCMNISWHCRVECTAYLLRTAAPTILIIVLSTNCLNRQWRRWRTTTPMVERDITAISVIVLLYHQHHSACMRKEGGYSTFDMWNWRNEENRYKRVIIQHQSRCTKFCFILMCDNAFREMKEIATQMQLNYWLGEIKLIMQEMECGVGSHTWW